MVFFVEGLDADVAPKAHGYDVCNVPSGGTLVCEGFVQSLGFGNSGRSRWYYVETRAKI